MRRTKLFTLPIIVIGLAICSHAQLWSGVLTPARAVDWSSAGTPIQNRTTVCATLNPGATAAQINSAISSCPSGNVVYLNGGTFNLSSGIIFNNKSNVTLRGAGANQTTLVFSGGISCSGLPSDICIQNGDVSYVGGPSNSANWTAGYAKGTTQITLSSTTGIKAGSTVLILDQLNDSSDPGTVYVCETQGTCSSEGPGGGERTNRSQQQMVTVSAVNGNTVTISPGIYMPNWRSSQTPQAWWANTVVTGVGVENLAVDHTSSSGNSGVVMFNASNSWLKGIKSVSPGRNHVWLYQTVHSVVRDSYFYGTQNAATESYGIEPFMSSDNLIENNIFQHITSPVTLNASASGTVIGYNYSTDDYYSVSPGWMMASDWMHASGVDTALFEGNQGTGLIGDGIHGTHNFITAFRNQFSGFASGMTAQTIPVHLYAGSRYFNIIGNVLGTSGYHNHYQDVTAAGTNADSSIYTLGWSGNEGTTGNFSNDPQVAATLMLWGNYDAVNNATRFVSTEVPTGISQYANVLPASQTLPASFYQSAKPSWWGNTAWPAIGPDVTGGSAGGGHAYAIPAQTCFNSGSKDSSGRLIFSSDLCYSTTTTTVSAPAPPTSLAVTVR